MIVVYAAYIVLIAFTIWMMIDAAKQDRFWWIVIILGLPVVGSVVYFYTEKKHEYAKIESHHVHGAQTEAQHETTPKKLVKRKKKEAQPVMEEVKKEEVTVGEKREIPVASS